MSYNANSMEEVARFFTGTVSVPMNSLPNNTNSKNNQQGGLNINSQLNTHPHIPISQLYIISQKTHSEETVNRNGLPKHIHLVVKNSPFNLSIGINHSSSNSSGIVDFNRIAFEASLLYDEGGKEVDYVKVKPVEFKGTPSENGQILDCEMRIKVLTSHHEDLLFKVKIQGYNPITKEEIPNLSLTTFPLKVISKPEQLKKRAPHKKRSLTDMLVETVTRIEKKQDEHQKLIERVITTQSMTPLPVIQNPINSLQNQNNNSIMSDLSSSRNNNNNDIPFWENPNSNSNLNVNMNSNSNSNSLNNNSNMNMVMGEDDIPNNGGEGKREANVEFEESFSQLIKAYNALSADEKPEMIRRLISNSSARDTDRLSELLDLFWTDGLLKEPSFSSRASNINSNSNSMNSGSNNGSMGGMTMNHSNECTCADCPHKMELERIDQFYKEFLTSGVSLPGF